MPFIVAVNDFGGPLHSEEQIREALTLGPEVPLVEFDARDHSSSKFVLIALVEYLHALSLGEEDREEDHKEDRAEDHKEDRKEDRKEDHGQDHTGD